MNIVLIGVMGSGKTTIGKLLARRLRMNFVDMDAMIETLHGPITQIFEQHGEDYFRDIELSTSKKLSDTDHIVISTGGGIVKNPENLALLGKNSLVFFLDRPVSVILESLNVFHRPLLKDNPEKLYEIHKERYALYVSQSDITIDASGSVQEVIKRILSVWNKREMKYQP